MAILPLPILDSTELWEHLARNYRPYVGDMWLDWRNGKTWQQIIHKLLNHRYRYKMDGLDTSGRAPGTSITAKLADNLADRTQGIALTRQNARESLKRAAKRADLTRAEKRLMLALYFVGTNQTELARLTRLSQPTISRHLPSLFAKIRENFSGDE